MAIVSIQRILNTDDRAVLDMEYSNIINNLKIGNIESDTEIIKLYQELMNTISGKTLSIEAAKKLQANYDQWAEQHISHGVTGAAGIFQASLAESAKDFAKDSAANLLGGGLHKIASTFPPAAIVTVAGTLAVTCVSQYFALQNARLDAEMRRELTADLLKIDAEEHNRYNSLQTRLIDSAWRLLRQYKLPDEYRIVQSGVASLFKAVNETDAAKKVSMLRTLERDFRIYPPYWIYRAEAEEVAGNRTEAAKCFDEFDKVWRPVLRNDPWKIEAAKFRVIEAVNSGDRGKALDNLEIICENVSLTDWADNIFTGLMYYMLGEQAKGIQRIEANVSFGVGIKTSKAILEQMKTGKMDVKSLSQALEELHIDASKLNTENISSMAKLRRAELLLQQKAGDKDSAEYKRMADVYYSTRDYRKAYVWYYVSGQRPSESFFFNNEIDAIEGRGIFTFAKLSSKEIEAAKKEAEDKIREIYAARNSQIIELLTQSAYGGNKEAQEKLAIIYYNGDIDLGVKRSYRYAYVWYYVSGQRPGEGFTNNNLDDMEGRHGCSSAPLSEIEIQRARKAAQDIIREIQASMIAGTPARAVDLEEAFKAPVAVKKGWCNVMDINMMVCLFLAGMLLFKSV